mmetsp:Transcript_5845/g.6517  ORF Transcript_5845/g.6517 Transcript_5845/m.6517 type:complete len:320 (-) Transcript_5845:43-1002(-)|eukprot:CAMPEP_0115024326 /NCGR_PEP_ID=MMETSP0216-20121206/33128_1 /TAXON_ID=223996 /ORGANISM="Protocruzia adherens, Strain Boccale" /LENGTH=319 /DNA_ID=CAMNT_0002398277 /DNA_START=74 /DNA_END=1033 /DNA_ORIENTATION=+
MKSRHIPFLTCSFLLAITLTLSSGEKSGLRKDELFDLHFLRRANASNFQILGIGDEEGGGKPQEQEAATSPSTGNESCDSDSEFISSFTDYCVNTSSSSMVRRLNCLSTILISSRKDQGMVAVANLESKYYVAQGKPDIAPVKERLGDFLDSIHSSNHNALRNCYKQSSYSIRDWLDGLKIDNFSFSSDDSDTHPELKLLNEFARQKKGQYFLGTAAAACTLCENMYTLLEKDGSIEDIPHWANINQEPSITELVNWNIPSWAEKYETSLKIISDVDERLQFGDTKLTKFRTLNGANNWAQEERDKQRQEQFAGRFRAR